MSTITIQQLQAQGIEKKYPRFKAGQTVKVHERIKEGSKERIQIFEGLIIQTGGTATGSTITVRKMVGGFGVEKVFSIHSPIIEKITITKEAKVRRSKLFYMRERKGKSARLKEKFMNEKDFMEVVPHEATEEEIAEAVEAQKDTELENVSISTSDISESTPDQIVISGNDASEDLSKDKDQA